MKIQVYMPVFNEVDILPHTLRHLDEQGVTVHVLDGWSTDGSYEYCVPRALGNTGLSVERFPAEGPDPIQNCTAILKRIEDLAADSDADWCMYSDADEWRRSCVPGQTLADTLQALPLAATAVDFRVYQFYCVDGSWTEPRGCMVDHGVGRVWVDPVSPERHFQHYDQADYISRIPNRKLWKNVGRVQLAGGGHEVVFPGMRVYPQKFVMKHYPFRTPAQAKAKIETRLARRCAEEHTKGWGVHYDQYPPGFDFCWDPAKLLYWKDTRSPLP
jgi:glycosyltransferase involved in cell wall biosynthesis